MNRILVIFLFLGNFANAADPVVDASTLHHKVLTGYVAMFDEVDEGTAIFKVSNTPPKPGRFVTYDGLPSGWYLRLTGEGTKLIRGERENQKTIPIKP